MILCVDGRLRKHKTETFDCKHPMLFPKKYPLTAAIIRYFHLYTLRVDPDQVLSLKRKKIWISDDKYKVNKELKNVCVVFAYLLKHLLKS